MQNDMSLEQADGSAAAALPEGQTFKFMEPLGKSLLGVLALAALMVLMYGLTFGVQALAESFHSPMLQAVADFFFYGGMMTKAVWQGEIWRPFTVAFLHGGMFHLFGNVVNFALLAYFCSIAFARQSWLVIFFTSSVLGAIATVLVTPETQLVGASIGIMGLYGSMIAAELRKRKIDKDLLAGGYPGAPQEPGLAAWCCSWCWSISSPTSVTSPTSLV
jgi:membrane associated rhomboid family serine protease